MISNISSPVKDACKNDSSGHDWWHIYRVVNLAKYIGEKEGANLEIVELAALLHDLDDWKLNESDGSHLPKARKILSENGYSNETIITILGIIDEVSFKGAGVETKPSTLEAMVVQDADRLDAIGAIGIARTFAYGGHKSQPLHDPDLKPNLHASFDEYKKTRTSTINHFYEKLLLLKDRLNTPAAKQLAEKRHQFMKQFLEQFYSEWNIE